MTDRGLKKITGPLRIEAFDNARATAFTYDSVTRRITGCLYDNVGKRVDLSMRTSGVGGDRVFNNDPVDLPGDANPVRHLQGTSVYLGHLMGHYGHFITETLSTFWALEDIEPSHFVFHPFLFGSKLLPFMTYFIESFKIDVEKIAILTSPCSFEKIIVPERTFHLNSHIHERYRDISKQIMDFHSLNGKDRSRKIFLSRSRLPNDVRGMDNSSELDSLMASLDFEVIHPQTLTSQEQLKIYSSTLVMAGLSGSALHNCIFLGPRSAVIEIGDARSPAKSLPTQVLCNFASEAEAIYVPFFSPNDADAASNEKNFDLLRLEIEIRRKIKYLSDLWLK